MEAAVTALLLGIFIGLALRPFLDGYVLWRFAKELDEQDLRAGSEQAELRQRFER
jgi:hypothetical protein